MAQRLNLNLYRGRDEPKMTAQFIRMTDMLLCFCKRFHQECCRVWYSVELWPVLALRSLHFCWKDKNFFKAVLTSPRSLNLVYMRSALYE